MTAEILKRETNFVCKYRKTQKGPDNHLPMQQTHPSDEPDQRTANFQGLGEQNSSNTGQQAECNFKTKQKKLREGIFFFF